MNRYLAALPRIVDETETYAVVYKPPLMFSAPRGMDIEATLLGWYARRCPAVLGPAGGRKGEGGLLHRLDFETEGLVLFAKTQGAYDALRSQQAAGDFVKEYLALTRPPSPDGGPLPGFPPPPDFGSPLPGPGSRIESFFRPWGPGRKAVRPLITARPPGKKHKIAGDRGEPYRTDICSLVTISPENGKGFGPLRLFGLRIRRGFRHQIRCHLAWIGEPILCDILYGGQGGPPNPAVRRIREDDPVSPDTPTPPEEGEKYPIGLRAWAFRFFDPGTGELKNYRLPSFLTDSAAGFT